MGGLISVFSYRGRWIWGNNNGWGDWGILVILRVTWRRRVGVNFEVLRRERGGGLEVEVGV